MSTILSQYTLEGPPKSSDLFIAGKFDVNGETTLDKTVIDTSKGNFIVGGAGNIGVVTHDPKCKLDMTGSTDAMRIPSGTTEQRPSNLQLGQMRYNTSFNRFEGYTIDNGINQWTDMETVWSKDVISGTSTSRFYLKYDTSRVGIGITETNSKLNIRDTSIAQLELSYDDTKYVKFTVDNMGKLQLQNFSDAGSTLYLAGTDSLKIPTGTTAQRPAAPKAEFGMIRYNAELKQFEGYRPKGTSGDGDWGSLGSTKDFDRNTYISVLDDNNENLDKIRFFTTGSERAVIDEVGRIGIGLTQPAEKLDISGRVQCANLKLTGSNVSNYVLISGDNTGEAEWKAPDISSNTSKTITYNSGSNYGDFTANSELPIPTLNHNLPKGKYYIFIDWFTEFAYHPPRDQILSLYYKEDSDWATNNTSEGTLLRQFFRSSNISGKANISTTIYLDIPTGKTYYFKWFRGSAGNFKWAGTNSIVSDTMTVDYVVPVSSGITGNDISGEINTGSNVGLTGVGIFKRKSTFDLEFKKLKAGSNVVLESQSDNVVINSLSSNPAYQGSGGSGASYNTIKSGFIKSAEYVVKEVSVSSDKSVLNIDAAQHLSSESISYTTGDILSVLVTDTGVAELDNKIHNVSSIVNNSGATQDLITLDKSSSTASGITGKVQFHYGNYTSGNISLQQFDKTLTQGDYYIFLSWTAKFIDRPLDDHKLDLYYDTADNFIKSYNGAIPGSAKKITSIYRSNSNSDQHTVSETIYLNVPVSNTYYLRWVRSSEGPYDWGTSTLDINTENFRIDYITPALNYWTLGNYESGGVNYPQLLFGYGDTNNGRVGIGTSTPKNLLDVNGIMNTTSIGIGTTEPRSQLEVIGDTRQLDTNSTITKYNSLGRKLLGNTAGTVNIPLFNLSVPSGKKGGVKVNIVVENSDNTAVKFDEYIVQFSYDYSSSTNTTQSRIFQLYSIETNTSNSAVVDLTNTSLTSATSGGNGSNMVYTFSFAITISGSSPSNVYANYNIDYFGIDGISITNL